MFLNTADREKVPRSVEGPETVPHPVFHIRTLMRMQVRSQGHLKVDLGVKLREEDCKAINCDPGSSDADQNSKTLKRQGVHGRRRCLTEKRRSSRGLKYTAEWTVYRVH